MTSSTVSIRSGNTCIASSPDESGSGAHRRPVQRSRSGRSAARSKRRATVASASPSPAHVWRPGGSRWEGGRRRGSLGGRVRDCFFRLPVVRVAPASSASRARSQSGSRPLIFLLSASAMLLIARLPMCTVQAGRHPGLHRNGGEGPRGTHYGACVPPQSPTPHRTGPREHVCLRTPPSPRPWCTGGGAPWDPDADRRRLLRRLEPHRGHHKRCVARPVFFSE